MQAGLLREIIDFEEAKEVKTASGFIEKEYVKVLTVKAYRKKLSAATGVKINAFEDFIGNTIVFQVRWHPAINEKQRIHYQGNTYKIVLLDRQRQDNTYIITCSKDNE